MKHLYGLALLGLLAACKRPASDDAGNKQPIIGTWQYTEQFTSIGGPGSWAPAKPSGQKIIFATNGRFVADVAFLKESTSYEMLDSARIKLTPALNELGYVIMGYQLDSAQQELQLYPLAPARCIEGCSSKFKRVSAAGS